MIYTIAHKYGELGYRDANNFINSFNQHHKNKYNGKFPVWTAFEVMTFGMLSMLYKNLNTADKKRISGDYYNVNYYSKISIWLHSISVLRNRCAHYSRIYNKTLSVAPSLPDGSHHLEINNNQLFSIIYVLKKLVTDQQEWKSWVTQLKALFEAYPEVELKLIGFKANCYIQEFENKQTRC